MLKAQLLKTWPIPFEAVWRGEKTHEIRKDDRNFKVGELLLLEEWGPETKTYSGRSILAEVTYKSPGGTWDLPPELCVLSIRVLTKRETTFT